eukprot:TRINITY_DN16250_c0_g1_i4.p1 TRINITY_DN16250_c0_g1~~TRINITY_DN16250_c0_g1_i4.p1  ORF type:complete len:434 (+),score=91.27 TRINITY_DN16250_c0_g1_i4:360-1661(+)
MGRRPLTATAVGKAFARRGLANMALGELMDAHHDLRSASLLMPGDAPINNDLARLQKLLLEASVGSDEALTQPTPFNCAQIERCAWGDTRIDELMSAGLPVIMSGASLAEPAVGKWTRQSLAESFGDQVKCTVFESTNAQFRYFDETKNEGGYPVPSTQMSKRELTFKEFSELVDDESSAGRHYLQQALVDGVGEEIASEFKRFDWEAAFKMRDTYSWGELTSNLLLVGQRGQTTPIHYDEQDNLFCQLHGHKRIVMASPDQHRALYPFPLHHSSDRQSQLDVFDPDIDLARFPLFPEFEAIQGTVGPGDVLFIPAYWWHHISSLDETTSVTFWFKCAPTKGSPVLPLCATQQQALRRNIERLIAEMVTPARVGRFFAWHNPERSVELDEDEEVCYGAVLEKISGLLQLVMSAEAVAEFICELGNGRFELGEI